MTKATVHSNGLVIWQPPAVYKSSCSIDVEYFPYDVQTCILKLGSWTYDGFKVLIFLFLFFYNLLAYTTTYYFYYYYYNYQHTYTYIIKIKNTKNPIQLNIN